MKLRAAIYARFSSENQHEESIEAQVQICKEYCKKKGYTVVKLYTDEAKSGTTTKKRDSYKLMLEDAKRDVYDIIIFHKIDRNARNENDYYNFKNEILSLGKQYAYAGQSLDASPEGQLMENNLVGFAAYFSRNLSKEVKKGQMVRAEKAMFLGGIPPLGYKVENQKYVIDTDTAGAIRMIFELYNDGYGYTYIINKLNSSGYKTNRGISFGKNSLHDILINEIYRGTYTFGKRIKILGKGNSHRWNKNPYRIENAVPPIISDMLWQSVQGKMLRRKKAPGSFSAKVPYLLSGLIECPKCHGKMAGYSYNTHGYKYYYYKCVKQCNHGKSACDSEKLPKTETERNVLYMLSKAITPEDMKKIIVLALERYSTNANSISKQIAELNSQKTNATKKLNNLYKVIEGGMADEFDLHRLSIIKNEIRAVETKLGTMSSNDVMLSPESMLMYWNDLINNLQKEREPSVLKSLLNDVVKKIVVTENFIDVDVGEECQSLGRHALALPPIFPNNSYK